ncbi:hypothetical protein OJ996_26240 [Luteolibacter sp. GHJ8]|uniref:Transmembrane protein n=1 Tax=Luteolibacter rhizosphaerae TaxID=2989719 RepID=A0ABT3GCC2_9BACT|nr:hypothetical protein [Luteolibacter rhizosphaerae]MCW1917114.1 hypothetical protein [Luteolibacter rhizosphaerae]
MPLRPTAFFYIFLLPVVILLWAWADSRQQQTDWVKVVSEDRVLFLTLADSRLHIRSRQPTQALPDRHLARSMDDRPAGRIFREPSSTAAADSWFPATQVLHGHSTDRAGYHYREATRIVPFWLILAAYLPAWLSLSYYYARRRRGKYLASLPPQTHAA